MDAGTQSSWDQPEGIGTKENIQLAASQTVRLKHKSVDQTVGTQSNTDRGCRTHRGIRQPSRLVNKHLTEPGRFAALGASDWELTGRRRCQNRKGLLEQPGLNCSSTPATIGSKPINRSQHLEDFGIVRIDSQIPLRRGITCTHKLVSRRISKH